MTGSTFQLKVENITSNKCKIIGIWRGLKKSPHIEREKTLQEAVVSDIFAEGLHIEARICSVAPLQYTVTPTIVVDRCPLFREGLQETLGDSAFKVIASTGDLKQIQLSAEQSNASLLVILVASTSLADDVAALKFARAQFPNGTIVSLRRDCQPQQAAALFNAGVGAILLVSNRAEGFIEALELAVLGQCVVPLHLLGYCVGSDDSEAKEASPHAWPRNYDKAGMRLSRLSIREVEIVQCLLAGEPNRSIAHRLMISEATVKVHVKAILRKINVKNRTQAAIWAVNNISVGGNSGCSASIRYCSV